jgi:mRNA-degrading endonuclease toxin of MazEF toxin-antitoxin module
MDVKQGEIYWVDIPASHTEGSEQYGRRPFIVMSRTALNKAQSTVIVVPLTTHQGETSNASFLSTQPAYRIVIPPAEITKDLSYNSAISVSVAKTDQARVIDKVRLGQKMGTLSRTAVISVSLGLAWVFDVR